MMKIRIDIIRTHNCCGNQESIPEVVTDFCNENGSEMDLKVYHAWDISKKDNLPNHIRNKLEKIQKGEVSSVGFFLNKSWLPISPHSPQDSVNVRNALCEAHQSAEGNLAAKIHGNKIEKQELKACLIREFALNDCDIQNLNTFCSTFNKITFFDGRIKELDVKSHVDTFHFGGYDIHKLVEAANKQPEMFAHARLNPGQLKITKVDISQISFIALKMKDLKEGIHPCVITDGCLNPESKPFISSAEIFGAWGYAAKHVDNICGFIGIMPKSIAQRDANSFIPPSSAEPEKTLLLTCFAGGGVFGSKYSRIGIAKGLVRTALNDARQKEYNCVEANPHDPGISQVLEKCGFHRVNLMVVVLTA